MTVCVPVSSGEAFLSSLLSHVDCRAQTLGSLGYQALAASSSPLSPVLTALLTIVIALFGLRLMLGDAPRLTSTVGIAARIGLVLALATSWSAFSTVIYDVVIHSPGRLGAAIAGPSGLPGAQGDMVDRLQRVDNGIRRLTDLGSGRADLTSLPPPQASPDTPQRAPIEDDPALGWARVVFLSTVAGVGMALRVTAGVLLALAPLFAGFLLFDFARSVFAGWLRALLFTCLGSLATNLLLGVQMAVLEPWLAQVLQLRQARVVTGSAPVELLILCLVFAVGLAGSLAILLRLAFTLHVMPSGQTAEGARPGWRSPVQPPLPTPATPSREMSVALPSRAALSAAAAAPVYGRSAEVTGRDRGPASRDVLPGGMSPTAEELIIPDFGQTLRRTRPRKSIGSALRDSRK